MDFKIFTAVMQLHESNFRMLHWGAKGKKFSRIHQRAEEYAEMIGKDLDAIAEMGLRMDQKPASFIESTKLLTDFQDHSFFAADSFKDISYDDFINTTDNILGDILYCIEELLKSEPIQDIKNVGIKADLEGLHGKYDLEKRYINARSCENC